MTDLKTIEGMTVKDINRITGALCKDMGLNIKVVAEKQLVEYQGDRTKKENIIKLYQRVTVMHSQRLSLVQQANNLGANVNMGMRTEILKEIINQFTAIQQQMEVMNMAKEQVAATTEGKVYTEEEVKAMQEELTAQHRELTKQALAKKEQEVLAMAAEKMQQVTDATAQAVAEDSIQVVEEAVQELVLTEGDKQKVIDGLDKQLGHIQQEMNKNITKPQKYNELVLEYRSVEEKLHALKGGDVQELIRTKYKGLTLSAAQGLLKGAAVVDKYGHAGVDRGTQLLNSVLESALGLTREVLNVTERAGRTVIKLGGEVGHAGVDLASGTLRATSELISKGDKE
ncbi:hypothetical protein 0305phi8-36p105 [Bacillus phage 0305phi8-36]|uniref:hypothetical protein n=1 Tax=Bacillus phage 0305phi8-36 TaxID=458639 RepID=UPI00015A1EBB|nr:hypothetical protein ST0305phi8-36p105 [Bacillus phage 0305phi8-36]YP_001429834.1 hypothetical protein ST0305phi8-36p105R [Bacillus phage 0305phi8-36]ABS83663.1 hypothetical protein 0305phi8-36p105R [Bacillus phage 0305phi8-36]ABS83805.1 hypothetical protein 0305phi8-36p105 [Bacillus phage 0305phi8-36]